MNLRQITKSVIEIASEAASYITREGVQFDPSSVNIKGTNDFVTHVDKGSEKLVVDKLGKLLPSAGFLVEENTLGSHGEKYKWVVDPLDGTTNFIHGIHPFAVSIALTEDDEPIAGVVCEASGNEIFSAWKGGGAELNGRPVKVSSRNKISEGFIATGFPYNDYSRLPEYLQLLSYLMKNTTGVRRLGAASIDLAYVACGRYEAFFEYSLKPWDIAAGSIIISEAGGIVSDFSGNTAKLTGREIIASNGVLHHDLLKIISNFMV